MLKGTHNVNLVKKEKNGPKNKNKKKHNVNLIEKEKNRPKKKINVNLTLGDIFSKLLHVNVIP